MKSVGEQLL